MRKPILTAVIAIAAITVKAQVADYSQVTPQPQSITATKGKPLVMDGTTVIIPTRGQGLNREAAFLSEHILAITGLKLDVSDKAAKGGRAIRLTIDRKRGIPEEGYVISVNDKGATITGSTPQGVFYGIQTLRKAMPAVRHCPRCKRSAESVELPPTVITDAPRFSYRGMMLDCARHFFSTDEVKRYIDMLALHCMNRFHWHLTDDQGWRFDVPGWPRLAEVGSRRAATVISHNSELTDNTPYGGLYSDDDIRDIVRYAADRHITIIPEVDMPGHMTAALAAYPELGCTGGPYRTGEYWGVYKDILCAGNEKTYSFLKAVLDKLCDLFPGEYIHIGGDESPRDRWKECDKCQAMIKRQGLMAKDGMSAEAQLQGYLARRVQRYLESKGRRIIGWDELLGCDVDTTATIMSWRGDEPGAKGARLGHDVIMAPTSHCYFDFAQSQNRLTEPAGSWNILQMKDVYDWNPVAPALDGRAAAHIKGVQANLWTEYIALDNVLEYQVLPRMAAIAEVQWMAQDKKDYDAFVRRVTSLRNIYGVNGWTYAHHLWPDEFRKTAKQY